MIVVQRSLPALLKDLNERLLDLLREEASSLFRWHQSLVHATALDG
jgi:hypothetical protein